MSHLPHPKFWTEEPSPSEQGAEHERLVETYLEPFARQLALKVVTGEPLDEFEAQLVYACGY